MSEPNWFSAYGWQHHYRGKVRELYFSEQQPDHLLLIASNRVSSFDRLLTPDIPGKGALLTGISRWWFAHFANIPNHLASWLPKNFPAELAARAMLVKKLDMFPIEAVVRGYLAGSSWAEYQKSQTVAGILLPPGLRQGDPLPKPLYTPARKMPYPERDQNVSYQDTIDLLGEQVAKQIRETSLYIFTRAAKIAAGCGLILADTKFEFGLDPKQQKITLADELLTPDSSRYWDAQTYRDGGENRLASFDKQIIRNWLTENWDNTADPPPIPEHIRTRTAQRYQELMTKLTGSKQILI